MGSRIWKLFWNWMMGTWIACRCRLGISWRFLNGLKVWGRNGGWQCRSRGRGWGRLRRWASVTMLKEKIYRSCQRLLWLLNRVNKHLQNPRSKLRSFQSRSSLNPLQKAQDHKTPRWKKEILTKMRVKKASRTHWMHGGAVIREMLHQKRKAWDSMNKNHRPKWSTKEERNY